MNGQAAPATEQLNFEGNYRMKCAGSKQYILFLILGFLFYANASAQFLDDFNTPSIAKDPRAIDGWAFFTGDGSATMDFVQADGFASILVDATKDQRNIWWALIKRCVSADLDLSLLSKPGYELRIEARIRVGNAPRRVNLSLNTQRTTDFHTNLMEFDIPDTNNWHTISMTTKDFDATPADTVFGQLALMDWGLGKYCVDVDYMKVDIVNVASAGPDKGVQVPYHPPIPDPNMFENVIKVAQDSTVDIQYPEMNFNNWHTSDSAGKVYLLTVNSTQFVVMRWDLSAFAGKKVAGSGLLELTTYSLQRGPDDLKDFGQVRIVEILGGDPSWNQQTVTYNSFCRGQPIDHVLNSQMIIDTEVSQAAGSKTLITISNPVLQRMIDGKTLGLAIRPLGAVNASFYAMENQGGKFSPALRFNLQK
jgi:hypothetical protein